MAKRQKNTVKTREDNIQTNVSLTYHNLAEKVAESFVRAATRLSCSS